MIIWDHSLGLDVLFLSEGVSDVIGGATSRLLPALYDLCCVRVLLKYIYNNIH